MCFLKFRKPTLDERVKAAIREANERLREKEKTEGVSEPARVQSDAVDALWACWANGEVPTPQKYLLDYEGGINGEGHHCFLDNNESELCDLDHALSLLLPADLYASFSKALTAYRTQDDPTEECAIADRYFYENESRLMDVIEDYAKAFEKKRQPLKDGQA